MKKWILLFAAILFTVQPLYAIPPMFYITAEQLMHYPGSGVANSTGSAWGTSYGVGTSANNLVQLDANGKLPAVSGSNLNLSAPPAIGGTTPNTLNFLYNTSTSIVTGNLTALQCSGGIVNNYGQTDDTAMTLPTAASGMSLIVVFSTAVSKYYRILPATGDGIYYEGVTQGTGSAHYVGVAATVVGQVIQFISFQTGASSYSWIVMPNFSGLVQP